MSVLFAGNELEAFAEIVGTVSEVTTAGRFDSAKVRSAIQVGVTSGTHYVGTGNYAAGAVTEHWAHFEYYDDVGGSGGQTGRTICELFNSVGTAVFRIQFTGTLTIQLQYWSGSAWTALSSTYVLTQDVLYRFDLQVICGASGSAELFLNETSALSGSASMTAVTNIAKARYHWTTTNSVHTNACKYSQIVCADEPTLFWKYYTKPPTGNGAYTAWTNDFAAVDEVPTSNADYIESTAADQIETFTGAALTLNGAVKAVVLSARMLRSSTGPQNAQFYLRPGGSGDYPTANISGIGLGFAQFTHIASVDPSTGTAWSTAVAGSAATEFGVKSIA